MNSTKTHVAYKEPMGDGVRIDPSKVVRTKKVQEDRAITSGVVIPRGYSSSTKTRVSNKTYEEYLQKHNSGGNDTGSMPFRYLRIPKHDKDA